MAVLAVLVASMITVLLGRTAQLQAGADSRDARSGHSNGVRSIIDPAERGQILDQAGRPLAASRPVLEIVVDPIHLYKLPGDGADVLDRLAILLGTSFSDIDALVTFCGSSSAVAGVCWDGPMGGPIPIAVDVELDQAQPVMEQPEKYPSVSVRMSAARSYPSTAGERAGHLLGYLGAVTAKEVDSEAGLSASGLIGRGGIEQQYDHYLRGSDGSRTVAVDAVGRVSVTLEQTPAEAGSTVVTTIDARLQAVVEQQLASAVETARDPMGQALPADSGAAVVLDVTNGHVLAMASYPDFSPSVFGGGISDSDYQGLLQSGALRFTPVQGTYAPGSIFKPFTVAAMAAHGFDVRGTYDCPDSITVGGRTFANYESRGYGPISLPRALEVSCNTVFYSAGRQIWQDTGGAAAGPQAPDPVAQTAASFGLGRATGVDLPGEAAGQVSGRQAKDDQWRKNRDQSCAAETGVGSDDGTCASAGAWHAGDAINASIGQGLTAVTPLQMAVAYAAIANGGTVFRPQVVKAIIDPDGTITDLEPKGTPVPGVGADTLAFLAQALVGVPVHGTAAAAFSGFPLDQVPVAGKTGSAQVSQGKPATAWFASFAPADQPRYAVVLMVTQGGTGGQTAAPSVRAIYDAIFGVDQGVADASSSVLVGGAPLDDLPLDAPALSSAGGPASREPGADRGGARP